MDGSVPRNANVSLGIVVKVVISEDTRKWNMADKTIASAIDLAEFVTCWQICFDKITVKPVIFERIPIHHIGGELLDKNKQNTST